MRLPGDFIGEDLDNQGEYRFPTDIIPAVVFVIWQCLDREMRSERSHTGMDRRQPGTPIGVLRIDYCIGEKGRPTQPGPSFQYGVVCSG